MAAFRPIESPKCTARCMERVAHNLQTQGLTGYAITKVLDVAEYLQLIGSRFG